MPKATSKIKTAKKTAAPAPATNAELANAGIKDAGVETVEIAIIGAGPAGLMAAETLIAAGHKPVLFDRMPTPARKFLMAGKAGLNITHSEDNKALLARYDDRESMLAPAITAFGPDDIRAWADGLAAETFIGSSGRVFPKAFKASPLLRAWLGRLTEGGAALYTRHKWLGWGKSDTGGDMLIFETPDGTKTIKAKATILALGGASWPRLGTDGTWAPLLADKGITVEAFRPANCGFTTDWSEHFSGRFAGEPVKNVVLSAGDLQAKGDFIINKNGVEGGAVYSLSAQLRDSIELAGTATVMIDLTPDRSTERLTRAFSKDRGKKSFATYIKRAAGLSGVKAGLLRECLPQTVFDKPAHLARAIKSLRLTLNAPRPVAEAISSAGGVSFAAVDAHLMLQALPGTFCAGEMLDWEAPTGGYLLTACLAEGKQAGQGAINWLANQ